MSEKEPYCEGGYRGCSTMKRIAELEAERIHFEAVAMTAIEENEKLTEQVAELKAEVERLRELYNELLYEVATKHPNETRHETALRYIRQRENAPDQCEAKQSSDTAGGGDE